MANDYTFSGQLSPKEALRSFRDIALPIIGAGVITALLQGLQILQNTDLGDWNWIVPVIVAIATPFLNRFLNIWRIK